MAKGYSMEMIMAEKKDVAAANTTAGEELVEVAMCAATYGMSDTHGECKDGSEDRD